MITSRVFGKTQDGQEVLAFDFIDGERRATVLNLGGIIQSIVVPAKDGTPTDVILGYNDVAGYEQNGGYLGALIGRFGNRIGKGELTIDGTKYQLYCNDRGNHLHGGKVGFNKKIWKHEVVGDELRLTIVSPDGEENYPGTLDVRVGSEGGGMRLYDGMVGTATRMSVPLVLVLIFVAVVLYTGYETVLYILISAVVSVVFIGVAMAMYYIDYEGEVVSEISEARAGFLPENDGAPEIHRIDDGVPGTPRRSEDSCFDQRNRSLNAGFALPGASSP